MRSVRQKPGRTNEVCRLEEASPNRWKDAGEAEWWRHGRCGQVARKDAAGRSPVHPLAPPAPLATGCPFAIGRHMYACTGIHIDNNNTHKRRESLFLSSELSSLIRSLSPSPSPPVSVSPPFLLPLASPLQIRTRALALTKLPVFVLQGIAGYCTSRVNTIINPLYSVPRANENLFF